MKGTGIGIAAEALDIGMNGHLSKPIPMEELLRKPDACL